MTSDDEKYVDYVDLFSSTWKRPEGPPRIWKIIDGKKKMANGDIPKFRIQEIPEDLKEEVMEFMLKHFIPEEPISVNRGLGEDPLGLREVWTLWRSILSQGMSIVALMVNSDASVKPAIAGVNLLGVTTAADEAAMAKKPNPFRSSATRTIMGTQVTLMKEAKVMEKYGIDKYLGAYGLSVLPSLRGQGLGDELLRTRNDIGLAYGIPVTETVFTATASQILAARNGFEVLAEKKYTEILDEEGNVAFPGLNVEFMKVMAKRLY